MPTYEYICLECGTRLEVRASLREKEAGLEVTCPRCESENTAQVFGNFAVGTSSGERRTDSGGGCGCGSGCDCN
ncbi:MAG: zinc ribbon domain-containing protein [Candidatus Neomarinimicrobiota bacterium]|nr:MAG: zinc ribbon domain-containing protein [Candidatus Neomarinimicrobiota bacterium]